jgi:hypothetical protein
MRVDEILRDPGRNTGIGGLLGDTLFLS